VGADETDFAEGRARARAFVRGKRQNSKEVVAVDVMCMVRLGVSPI